MKNFYKPQWVVVWYGRSGTLREKPFDDYKKAERDAKRRQEGKGFAHAAILYREVKVEK